MNAQPDPSPSESESHARLSADASHEREVVQNMIFTSVTGLIAIITAIFTTTLELTVFWRNVWLTLCITFAVLMFAGIFQFCGHIDTSTSPKIIKH
jgi:fatty acid desaturase